MQVDPKLSKLKFVLYKATMPKITRDVYSDSLAFLEEKYR